MKKLSLPKFLVLSLFAFTFSFTNISCIGNTDKINDAKDLFNEIRPLNK